MSKKWIEVDHASSVTENKCRRSPENVADRPEDVLAYAQEKNPHNDHGEETSMVSKRELHVL